MKKTPQKMPNRLMSWKEEARLVGPYLVGRRVAG
jgi:hypothetical protein